MIRRIIVLAGLAGILHSSLVPPVEQSGGSVCRYTEFWLRSWPFTHGYGVEQADLTALLSEYGILISLTAMAWVIAGWWESRYRQENAAKEIRRERPVA